MKLRFRYSGKTQVTTLADAGDGAHTLLQLREIVRQLFDIDDFELSLNGRDPVIGEDEVELKDLGLVSGDLVHVLSNSLVAPSGVRQLQPDQVQAGGNTSKHNESGTAVNYMNTEANNELHKQDERLFEPSCSTSGQKAGSEAFDMDFPEDEEAVQDAEVNRYLNEPTLVRDSTDNRVPQSLQMSFQSGPVECASDAFVIVLHVLMVETGYQTVHTAAQSAGTSGFHSLPSGWKCGSTYRIMYTQPSCPDTEFGLTAVPMGSNLIIHGLTKGMASPIHCQMPVKTGVFVKNCNSDSDPTQVYENLPKLSRLFKDKIAHLLLQKAAEALGLPLNHGLLGLIFELKMHVLKFLDARSLCRVACVCKELQSLASEPALWRRLYLRDFGRRTNNDVTQDWRQLYREKYILRQRMRRDFLRSTIVVPPDLGRPNPPFPMAPVYPPGFIGGDYDRDPGFASIPGPLGGGNRPNPMFPRPRFDPIGPLPPHRFPPGRGFGIWESARPKPAFGGFGPKFF